MMNDSTSRRRLAVARFWYEGNAFCLQPATREDFVRREWHRGQSALDTSRDTATELAAVADFADAHADWEVVVLRCTSALPSGPIEDAFFDEFLAELLADLKAQGPWDAVYLSLHGASLTPRRGAPEQDLLDAVQQTLPGVPVGASFDLHANAAPGWTRCLSAGSGYHTYPHIDMRDAAARVLTQLLDVVGGRTRPVGVIRNDGVPLSSANMRTEAGPMAELEALARSLMKPPVLDVTVFGGFAYANTEHIGASAMVWADGDVAAAQAAADQVCAALAARTAEFDIPLLSPAEGIALALQTPGLVAVTDAADNPLSGGIGDTPELLRALLAHGVTEATVFASMADPAVVQAAQQAGAGARLQLRLGGRLTADFGAPVLLDVVVERLTEGRYTNTGPMERGAPVDCGDTVVLRQGLLELIVTTHVAACNDPAFFALHGIDLTRTRLLCVKAKNHFRAAFKPLCATIVDIDAPGPAALDLRQLPLRRRG